mmetsp:Transcript_343/g.597  ORF Transcript_343/g.597 Transcript_343/m.597 type:complete len:89 (+) Transcript_343:2623-2889(+)
MFEKRSLDGGASCLFTASGDFATGAEHAADRGELSHLIDSNILNVLTSHGLFSLQKCLESYGPWPSFEWIQSWTALSKENSISLSLTC